MATTLPEPQSDLAPELSDASVPNDAPTGAPAPLPDATSLEDRMPEWFRTPAMLTAFAAVIGVVYCLMSYHALTHSDLWGHLAYGRVIIELGAIPATEPLMPLAEGMRFTDTAWLSQVVGAMMYRAWDAPGIQFLYATSISLCLALLAWTAWRRSHGPWLTLLSLVVFCSVAWAHLGIMRPQLAGMCCFILVFSRVTAPHLTRLDLILLPAVFALWANLHGSFPVGLLLLGLYSLGRVIDGWRRSGKLAFLLRDTRLRRLVVLTELCLAAVLLNPYGLGLFAAVREVSSSANFAALPEWGALDINMLHGKAMALTVLLLAVVFRSSPRRITSGEALSLAVFGGLSLWASRMVVWWAPLAAVSLATHAAATWRARHHLPLVREPQPASSTWTVVTLGIVWISFGFTPFGQTLLHGPEDQFRQRFDDYTPVRAVDWLVQNPQPGQIFNTYEWGDYLLWAGPPQVPVFVASHAHLVPAEVWSDYLQIINVQADWEETLERYGVNTMLLDQARRRGLIAWLRRSESWQVSYEDSTAVVFTRRQPIL